MLSVVTCDDGIAGLLDLSLEVDALAVEPHLGDEGLSRQYWLHEASLQRADVVRVVAAVSVRQGTECSVINTEDLLD